MIEEKSILGKFWKNISETVGMTLLHRAFEIAHFINPDGGTCLEFGVFRGQSYCWQARQIKRKYRNSRLIGFDSWEGLPPETDGVWAPKRHAPGEFSAPKDAVLKKLRAIGVKAEDPRFRLVDGFFNESLTPELQDQIAPLIFVNIDVDIHSSTIDLLKFIGPALRPGTVLYWDDWKDPRDEHEGDWGLHLAWEEWSSTQQGLEVETLEVNAVNQRSMVVTAANGARLSAPQPTMSNIRFKALEEAEKGPDAATFLAALSKRQIRRVGFLHRMARGILGRA